MRLPSIDRILGVAVVAGFAVFLGARLLTLYTSPWAPFVRPTREFLSAAAAHDSIRLAALGTPDTVIRRTLAAATKHPNQVGIDRLRLISGRRSGDTTRVTFFHGGCSGNLLVLTFVGRASRPRIHEASLPCSRP